MHVNARAGFREFSVAGNAHIGFLLIGSHIFNRPVGAFRHAVLLARLLELKRKELPTWLLEYFVNPRDMMVIGYVRAFEEVVEFGMCLRLPQRLGQVDLPVSVFIPKAAKR